MRRISFAMLRTGSCRTRESLVIRGGRAAKVDVPALVTVLEHPELGAMLFDTGYASSMFPHIQNHWSERVYMRLLPVTVPPEEDAAHQLRRRGVDPAALRRVILSHFHPDHIGGARDFPQAEFFCLREAWDAIRERRGWPAARRGFFPGLLPADFERRVRLLDAGRSAHPGFEAFGPAVDVLGDGSLWGIALPGHAAGQMGLVFESVEGRRIFLCADACWYRRSYRENRPPSPLTYPLLEGRGDFFRTFDRIRALHRDHPEVEIFPAHCPECVGAKG